MWNPNSTPPGFTPNVTDPSQAPGASRGLLTLIKEYLGGWLGPRLGASTNAGVQVAAEQVHSGPSMVVLPWFLPYFDDYTGETPQARAAYRRMFADPNVKSALLGKLLAVGALDLKIRPAEKKNPLDEEVAEFVKWTLTERVKDGFPGMVWSILSGGLVDGYSVCEKVFGQEEGGEFDKLWPLVAVKPKDVGNDLVLQTDSYRNVVSVMGLRYNAGQYFSPARFLIWRHLPLYDTPTGMSDLRAVYSRYWLLDTILKLRGVNAEKRAIPFLMGTYQNPSQQRSLENTLALVKSQSWVTVPEGVRVEALNIAGSSDAIFEGFIRDLKHDIFMGIQGAILQALEGSVTDGRGNSQVHRSTADLLVWYLAQSLQTLLNDRTNGLIKDIVDLNYVVNRYPRATLSAVDVGEMTAELDIDTKLHGMGVELSKEDMYERYNRVPPLSPLDALKKDGGGTPGMPGPGGPGGGGLPPGGPPGLGGPDDPMGGDADLDGGEVDDDGLFDEQNLFTAPMRQFAEWEESKHPRADDGKFGSGSGGRKKGGGRLRAVRGKAATENVEAGLAGMEEENAGRPAVSRILGVVGDALRQAVTASRSDASAILATDALKESVSQVVADMGDRVSREMKDSLTDTYGDRAGPLLKIGEKANRAVQRAVVSAATRHLRPLAKLTRVNNREDFASALMSAVEDLPMQVALGLEDGGLSPDSAKDLAGEIHDAGWPFDLGKEVAEAESAEEVASALLERHGVNFAARPGEDPYDYADRLYTSVEAPWVDQAADLVFGLLSDSYVGDVEKFAEWEESKHPRAVDGKFGSGSGGGSKKERREAKVKAKEQRRSESDAYKTRHAGHKAKIAEAKAAIHAHTTKADALQTELVNLYWGAKVVEKVHDLLFQSEQSEFKGSMGRTHVKDENNRLRDFQGLERATAKALEKYATPRKDPKEAEDQGKVLATLRKIRLYARQGVRLYRAAREAQVQGRADLDANKPAHMHAEGRWDESKHPRGKGGRFGRGTSGAQAKKKAKRAARREAGGGSVDHTSGPSPRKSLLRAAGTKVMSTIRKAKHKVEDVEHVVADYLAHGVDRQIERLPPGTRQGVAATWWLTKLGTKAAFIAYTTGQRMAEKAAKDSGATPEQAARIRAVCTAVDLAGAKIVPLALGAVGLGAIGLPASFVIPAGSAAYLAYSKTKRALAALKAARRVVKGMTETLLSKFGEVDEDTLKLAMIYLAGELAKGTISPEEYGRAVEMLTDNAEEFAEEDWEEGKSRTGGPKWTNRNTRAVKYQKENPGKSKRKPAGEKGPEGGTAPAGGKAHSKPEAKAAHPLAGMTRAQQIAALAKIQGGHLYGTGSPDPLGLAKAGKPDVMKDPEFEQDVVGALARHRDKVGVGANLDALYEAIGGRYGISKFDFQRALVSLADESKIKLGGWPRSLDDVPDPELMTPWRGKLMWRASPASENIGEGSELGTVVVGKPSTPKKAAPEAKAQAKEKPAAKSTDGGLNLARLVHTIAGKSDVGELAGILGGLHNDDLQGLKKEWKLKVGGTKAAQAKALAKHVLDAVRGGGESKPSPEKKTATRNPAVGGKAEVKATADKVLGMARGVSTRVADAGGDRQKFFDDLDKEIGSLGMDRLADADLKALAKQVSAAPPQIRPGDRKDPAKVRQAQINEIRRVILVPAELAMDGGQ